jgi:hypothetical protein
MNTTLVVVIIVIVALLCALAWYWNRRSTSAAGNTCGCRRSPCQCRRRRQRSSQFAVVSMGRNVDAPPTAPSTTPPRAARRGPPPLAQRNRTRARDPAARATVRHTLIRAGESDAEAEERLIAHRQQRDRQNAQRLTPQKQPQPRQRRR